VRINRCCGILLMRAVQMQFFSVAVQPSTFERTHQDSAAGKIEAAFSV
jgi:hypothetical protein